MKIVKSFFIACSMYSQIPVPQFAWKEEDMKYVLCFFPFIGAVIGWCLLGWEWLSRQLSVGGLCFTLIGTAIPLLVTGGFHADGFMDTMDALHSYRDKEGKLEILKDSHIGAFAVLMLLLYYLVYLAAFSEVRDMRLLRIVSLGFVLSRSLSGIGIVIFRPAKKDGMLRLFADAAAKRTVITVLMLQLLLCAAGLLLISRQIGIPVLLAAGLCFGYYRYRSYKEFGGVTGDTAGCFVLLCEAAVVIATAVGSRW